MHPDIAARLAALSRALENASLETSGDISFFDVSNRSGLPRVRLPDPNQAARIKLAMEYNSLLRQVQSLDGFQRLLKPRPSAELIAAAVDGPVVLVNLHERRSDCDALILLPTQDIRHVALPRFSYAAAARFQESLQTALERGGLRQRAARIISWDHDDTSIADILNGLWSYVAEPVLDALKDAVSSFTSIASCQSLQLSDSTRIVAARHALGRRALPHHLVCYRPASLPPSSCSRML